jgi:hypothetical protein
MALQFTADSLHLHQIDSDPDDHAAMLLSRNGIIA